MTGTIVIATPHARYAPLIERVRRRSGVQVVTIADRAELTAERLDAITPDYVFFPHWSWKIPPEVHERHRAVIFHMTDLPYGRGGSPLQNLVRRGHRETMLSAIACVAEMDAGAVYLKRPLSLLGTAEEIFMRAAALIEDMIVDILERRPEPVPQQGEVVEFRRLKPEDGDLAQAGSLEQWHDMIRMLDADGYPPSFIRLGRFRIEFGRASLKPGHVIADVRISVHDDQ